jgi:hypothetical protein
VIALPGAGWGAAAASALPAEACAFAAVGPPARSIAIVIAVIAPMRMPFSIPYRSIVFLEAPFGKRRRPPAFIADEIRQLWHQSEGGADFAGAALQILRLQASNRYGCIQVALRAGAYPTGISATSLSEAMSTAETLLLCSLAM